MLETHLKKEKRKIISTKKNYPVVLEMGSTIDYSSSTSYAGNKLRCVEIETKSGFKFNLFGAHLYSQTGISKPQQLYANKDIPTYTNEFQNKQKNENFLIVGNLNYRPFDIDLNHPEFLNANNDRVIIDLFKKRSFGVHKYNSFYNPMWNVLGDYDYINNSEKKPGTYYWYPDDLSKFHWNLIDGVLLSPNLMHNIDIPSINILSKLNHKDLVKPTLFKINENLIIEQYSDHLPVIFSLKI